MDATVFVRGADRSTRGPLDVRPGSEARLILHGVGSWRFQVDAADPKAGRLVPGGGVLVVDDETSESLLSGPMTARQESSSAGDPTVLFTAQGLTDEIHLQDREMYPNPAAAVTAQTATARYEASGVGSTVIRNAVNLQAGPGALVARRVAGLTVEADPVVGSNVVLSVRFKPNLLETIAALAETAGVVWWVEQQGVDLVFRIRLPRDLSRRARFSRDMGNLSAYTHAQTAPTVTRAAVLGQGEGTLRTVRERADAAAESLWGRRIEQSVDRRDTDTDDALDQAGDETLLEGGSAVSLDVEPIDLPRLRYGRDYKLGDLVTVELAGASVTNVVREVVLTWSGAGVTAKPLIGPVSAKNPAEPVWVSAIRKIKREQGRLEAGQ